MVSIRRKAPLVKTTADISVPAQSPADILNNSTVLNNTSSGYNYLPISTIYNNLIVYTDVAPFRGEHFLHTLEIVSMAIAPRLPGPTTITTHPSWVIPPPQFQQWSTTTTTGITSAGSTITNGSPHQYNSLTTQAGQAYYNQTIPSPPQPGHDVTGVSFKLTCSCDESFPDMNEFIEHCYTENDLVNNPEEGANSLIQKLIQNDWSYPEQVEQTLDLTDKETKALIRVIRRMQQDDK